MGVRKWAERDAEAAQATTTTIMTMVRGMQIRAQKHAWATERKEAALRRLEVAVEELRQAREATGGGEPEVAVAKQEPSADATAATAVAE